LNWIALKKLLCLSKVVADQVPGKCQTITLSWKNVFMKIDDFELYEDIVK